MNIFCSYNKFLVAETKIYMPRMFRRNIQVTIINV